jgi:hypothetical protein
MDWKKLAEPFPPEDIEWRIAQKGKTNDGAPWAKVLAYVTNRAIMQRLDDVCGPENWRNEFQHIEGAFLCGLSVRVSGEWITKWDGAQESQIEATKGGISGAMKRAAVQWGIGRYLYNLEEGWALVGNHGKNYVGADKGKNIPAFKWDPPTLPDWALPANTPKAKPAPHKPIEQAPHKDIPPFLKLADVLKELEGAFSAEELAQIFKSRYPMANHHYNKGEMDQLMAKKDEMKTRLAP